MVSCSSSGKPELCRSTTPGRSLCNGQADTLALVSTVNRPGLTLNLDLYHAQIGEGNLIELCRMLCLPWIGEIQVADVPGRKEPGTGEINYTGIARALEADGLSRLRLHGSLCLR